MMISKMKILILSPFFFPEPISTGKFNTTLAKALRDQGMEVTVICSHPLYPSWSSKKTEREIEGIKIIRGGANIKYPKNLFLKRVLLELGYASFVLKTFYKLRDETDLIVPVFPPSLAFYSILPILRRKTVKIALVHDLQEVYMRNRSGTLKKMVHYVMYNIEKANFQNCDKLIFLSEEMKKTATSCYHLDQNKLFVQYPFVNIDTSSTTNNLSDLLPKNKKHIVYAGALGEKHDPSRLYELFNFASERIPNTDFHFFSDGIYFSKLKETNKNPFIRFHNLVEEKDLFELYTKSAVQIIPQKEGTSKGSLPSKLPNLLASGCNLLVITDKGSELETLFRTYGLNSFVTLWDNEEICKKLKEITDLGKTENPNHISVSKKLFQLDFLVNEIIKSKTV